MQSEWMPWRRQGGCYWGCGGRSIGSLLLGVSTVEVGGEVLQKTKIGYGILAHLYCHLLCDFPGKTLNIYSPQISTNGSPRGWVTLSLAKWTMSLLGSLKGLRVKMSMSDTRATVSKQSHPAWKLCPCSSEMTKAAAAQRADCELLIQHWGGLRILSFKSFWRLVKCF